MSLEGKSPAEIEALAALANDVLGNPKTAGVFQRLVKANNPNVSMPLVELEDKTVAALAARDKKIDALETRVTLSDAEKAANQLFENLRDAGSVTTRASFNELVTWANTNGFMATEQGLKKAALQRSIEMEAAEPTAQHVNNGFELAGKDDQSKAFMKDPIGTARAAAAKAMDELRAGRAKGAKTH